MAIVRIWVVGCGRGQAEEARPNGRIVNSAAVIETDTVTMDRSTQRVDDYVRKPPYLKSLARWKKAYLLPYENIAYIKEG